MSNYFLIGLFWLFLKETNAEMVGRKSFIQWIEFEIWLTWCDSIQINF